MRWSLQLAWLLSLSWLMQCQQPHPNGEKAADCPADSDSLRGAFGVEAAALEAVPLELNVPGEVVSVPSLTVEVRAGVAGRVTEVYVQLGQSVKAGAPLLRLRAPELLQWEAEYRSTQAQFEAQQLKVKAYERLRQDSLLSLTEWQAAQAELASLKARVEQLAQQLQLFRRAGEEFLVVAPRAGTVVSLNVSAGSTIEASQVLLRIADLSQVRLQVYLYAEQLMQARVGMEGKAYFSGLSEPVRFRLTDIQPVLEEETRAAIGYADLPNPGGGVRPGAFFLGRLRLLQTDSAVALPLSALVLDADQRYAILWHPPCSWEVRPVQLLRQVGERAYVRNIAPGEQVATQKVLFLYEQLTRTL